MIKRSANPMRRSWLSDEGWIAHRLRLLVSPAWQNRPRPLARLLERLEIENMRHAGRENGRLVVSYDQFVEYGISRRVVRAAIDAGKALGLLGEKQSDELVGNIRMPNEYRLTYVPAFDKRAPTDEWESVTGEEAGEIAKTFAAATGSQGQKQRSSSLSGPTAVPFPAPIEPDPSSLSSNIPVPQGEPSLISAVHATDAALRVAQAGQFETSPDRTGQPEGPVVYRRVAIEIGEAPASAAPKRAPDAVAKGRAGRG